MKIKPHFSGPLEKHKFWGAPFFLQRTGKRRWQMRSCFEQPRPSEKVGEVRGTGYVTGCSGKTWRQVLRLKSPFALCKTANWLRGRMLWQKLEGRAAPQKLFCTWQDGELATWQDALAKPGGKSCASTALLHLVRRRNFLHSSLGNEARHWANCWIIRRRCWGSQPHCAQSRPAAAAACWSPAWGTLPASHELCSDSLCLLACLSPQITWRYETFSGAPWHKKEQEQLLDPNQSQFQESKVCMAKPFEKGCMATPLGGHAWWQCRKFREQYNTAKGPETNEHRWFYRKQVTDDGWWP